MRLVLDTNVVVSAFLWEGTPGRLIELAADKQVRRPSQSPATSFRPA
jgi:predicted nucleic acid-binding protein